jgi:hypothetical protein
VSVGTMNDHVFLVKPDANFGSNQQMPFTTTAFLTSSLHLFKHNKRLAV